MLISASLQTIRALILVNVKKTIVFCLLLKHTESLRKCFCLLFTVMVHLNNNVDACDPLKTVKVLKPFNQDDDDVAVFGWQKYLRETKET